MPTRIKSVAGFVLAGGASRRMGRPKALLILGTETMIGRQVRVLRSVTRNVRVVGWPSNLAWLVKPKNLSHLGCLPDAKPGSGPLGGIYTALQHSKSEINLILGCDLPFVEPGLLKFLCWRAAESRADVIVPKSNRHGLEPLCAVYSRRALPVIRAALEAGNFKVTQFYSRVRCEVIPWREIALAGFTPRVFDNMNVWEDYSKAREFLATFAG
jgi:molybdopterin-guanine dinucleotide biosynthesis protein A